MIGLHSSSLHACHSWALSATDDDDDGDDDDDDGDDDNNANIKNYYNNVKINK